MKNCSSLRTSRDISFAFFSFGLLEISQERSEMCSLANDRYPGEQKRTWSLEMGPGPKSSTAQVRLRAPFPCPLVSWADEPCSTFANLSQVEGISQLQPASTVRLNHNIPESLYIYTVRLTAGFPQAL